MSDEDIKKHFSRMLTYYIKLNGKQPTDVVKDLNIPFSTFSNWCTGEKMPRMGNVELLANYFHIKKSDLLDGEIDTDNMDKSHYLNTETAKIAQEIFEQDKILFDVYKGAKKDDLIKYAEYLKSLEEKEEGGN